jgi:hypothetical protein
MSENGLSPAERVEKFIINRRSRGSQKFTTIDRSKLTVNLTDPSDSDLCVTFQIMMVDIDDA